MLRTADPDGGRENMEGMPTALRGFFAKLVDTDTLHAYAQLVGLVIAVIVMAAMIVATQFRGL
jgi:hypothetical protein